MLLLSWIVIFAHGIIPHNHCDEVQPSVCQAGHPSSDLKSAKTVLIQSKADADKVCHLLNILFQNFNPENICSHYSKEAPLLCSVITGKIYISFSDSIVSDKCSQSALFRAPPVA